MKMTVTEGNRAEMNDLKEEVKILEEEVEVLEELIDLEEWAKAGREPKKAKKYRLRIDKDYKVVEVHEMNGREILGLVGKTPEKYLLSQKLHGGRHRADRAGPDRDLSRPPCRAFPDTGV